MAGVRWTLVLLLAVAVPRSSLCQAPNSITQAACDTDPCFSSVVASCGSCFPTTSKAFCKSPCHDSWGSAEAITCLGNAGNTYWLQNMEQLNVKCGFPPIPNAAGAPSLGPGPAPVATATTTTTTSSAGAASPSSGGLVTSSGNAAAGAPPYVATPAGTPVAGPVTQSTGATTTASVPVVQASSTGTTAVSSGTTSVSTGGRTAITSPAGVASGTTPGVTAALAAFPCTASTSVTNQATASTCVTAITTTNKCTTTCQAAFNAISTVCRNAMVQDTFYGITWRSLYTTCGVTYDLNGPTASNTATPAQLATAQAAVAAANAATVSSASSSGTMPLLAAPTGAPTLFATSAAPQLRIARLLPVAVAVGVVAAAGLW